MGSDGEPFFLKTGCIFACFQIVGKDPRRNDLLNSIERGSAIMIAESLIIFEGSWSSPLDLLGSSEFRL